MKIPQEFQSLSRMSVLSPVPSAADFSDVDVALLEPASPIVLTFRGVAFHRNAITTKFIKPIADRGREERKVAAAWLRHGLVGLNDEIRAEAAAKLAGYVVGDTPEDDFARAVFLEVRSKKTDVLGGFTKMRELLNRPIGVVCYNFRYMPDGRPISWPAGFREEVLAAAPQLHLPVFAPAPMVQSFGDAAALAAGVPPLWLARTGKRNHGNGGKFRLGARCAHTDQLCRAGLIHQSPFCGAGRGVQR